ncbi:MAG: hypothetical protein WCP68_06170, partial [Enhydrobacter sp.]
RTHARTRAHTRARCAAQPRHAAAAPALHDSAKPGGSQTRLGPRCAAVAPCRALQRVALRASSFVTIEHFVRAGDGVAGDR